MKFEIYSTLGKGWSKEDGAPVPGSFWDDKSRMWVIEIGTLDELMRIVEKYGGEDSLDGKRVVITAHYDKKTEPYPTIELYDGYRE